MRTDGHVLLHALIKVDSTIEDRLWEDWRIRTSHTQFDTAEKREEMRATGEGRIGNEKKCKHSKQGVVLLSIASK